MNIAISAELAEIRAGSVLLHGDLLMPPRPRGLVIFAHGSGSSRFSGRNRRVAETLHIRGYATLLLDLLTAEEEAVDIYTAEFRFDVARLAARVRAAVEWASTAPALVKLPIGLFGASTGAAAALIAAAERPDLVHAVVSQGGRPDLANGALPLVHAPTLLIVGGADRDVLEMNRSALRQMRAHAEVRVINGATHLFDEPGTLEESERAAGEWFEHYVDEALDRRLRQARI